jgi:quinol monooxygenase YgiN
MSEPIVLIDSSLVRQGKLEDLKTAMKELVEFVEANETRPTTYNVFFSEDETLMTVVQVHPDSASVEFHMKEAAHLFPKFTAFINLQTMDIYGKPSAELLERMQQKAQMLGSAPVAVHDLHAGFARFSGESA